VNNWHKMKMRKEIISIRLISPFDNPQDSSNSVGLFLRNPPLKG